MRLPKRVFKKEQMEIMELKNTIIEIKVSLEKLNIQLILQHCRIKGYWPTHSAICICGFSTKELSLEQHWLELCESVKLWSVEKKSAYKWSHAVQTHAVQELTVFELAEERITELKGQLRLCKPRKNEWKMSRASEEDGEPLSALIYA